MKSEVQKELNKLLQLKDAFVEARDAFSQQFELVRNILPCPVCPNGNGRIEQSFGSYEIVCDCCGFHVGKTADLKELLDRWTAVYDAIEEQKKLKEEKNV